MSTLLKNQHMPRLQMATFDEGLYIDSKLDITQQIATLINSETYTRNVERLSEAFFPAPDNEHEKEAESIRKFVNACEIATRRLIWRPADNVRRDRDKNIQKIKLTNKMATNTYNTGVEPIAVGETIYAIPPLYTLCRDRPSSHFFLFGNKIYMMPIIMTRQQRLNLLSDISDARKYKENWNQQGAVSPIARKVTWDQLSKLWNFVNGLKKVGWVQYKLANPGGQNEGYNPSLDDIAPGDKFVLRMEIQ